MNVIPGLDIFFAPGALSPETLVSDMRAGGFMHVGLYAYDDDVSSLNGCSAAHIDAVRNAGMTPVPIITQRSVESDISDKLLFSLRDKHWDTGPVWFDIEDTATPAVDVVKSELVSLGKAGYGPFMSYLWRPNVWEPIYGPLFQYKWWGGGSTTVIPDGWDAIQTGFWVGPSGTNYDTDVFADYVFGEDIDMDRLVFTAYPNPNPTAQALVNLDRGWKMILPADTDLKSLETLTGAKSIDILSLSQAFVDALPAVGAVPAAASALTVAQDAALTDVHARVDKDLAP